MEIKSPREIKGKIVSTLEDGDDLSWVHQWTELTATQREDFIREAEHKSLLDAQRSEAVWIQMALRDHGFISAGTAYDLKQYPIDAMTFPPTAFPRLSHEVVQYPARTDEDRELEEIGLCPLPRTAQEDSDDLPQEVVIPQEKRGHMKRIQAGDVVPEAPAPIDRVIDPVIRTRAMPRTGLFGEGAEQQEFVESSDNVAEVVLRERTAEEIKSDHIQNRIFDIGRTTRSEIVTTATMPYDDSIAKIMADNGDKNPVEMSRAFMLGRIQVFWHAAAQFPEGHPLRANAQRVLYVTHPEQRAGLIIFQVNAGDRWQSANVLTAPRFLAQQTLPENLVYFPNRENTPLHQNVFAKVPDVLKTFEAMDLKMQARQDEWPRRYTRPAKNCLEEFSIGWNKSGVPVVIYEVLYLDAGNRDKATRVRLHSFPMDKFTDITERNDILERLEPLRRALPMRKIDAVDWLGAMDLLMKPKEILSRRQTSPLRRQFRIASRSSLKIAKQLLAEGQAGTKKLAHAAREKFEEVRDRMPDITFELPQPAQALARVISMFRIR